MRRLYAHPQRRGKMRDEQKKTGTRLHGAVPVLAIPKLRRDPSNAGVSGLPIHAISATAAASHRAQASGGEAHQGERRRLRQTRRGGRRVVERTVDLAARAGVLGVRG